LVGITANIDGYGDITASLTIFKNMTSAINGTSDFTSNMGVIFGVNGTIDAAATVTANANLIRGLNSAIAGNVDITAHMTAVISLLSTIAASGTVTGQIQVVADIAQVPHKLTSLLETDGYGTAGTNLFASRELSDNDISDNCIFVYLDGGIPAADTIGSTAYRNPNVTVLIRNKDYRIGKTLAENLWNDLHYTGDLTGVLACSTEYASPTYLGKDDIERHKWTISLRFMV
jgi:hypothetical protein